MAANYTANPAATQAPGPLPATGAVPIISLPADTDGASWANIYQALKESVDFIAYLQLRNGSNLVCTGLFGTTGGVTPVINLSATSYNVASVTRTGVGQYTVTIGGVFTLTTGATGIVLATMQSPSTGITQVCGLAVSNTTFTVTFYNGITATDPNNTSVGFAFYAK